MGDIVVCRLKCPASQPPNCDSNSGEKVKFHQRGQAASVELAITPGNLKSFSGHSRRVIARKESLRIPAAHSWESRKSRRFTTISASILSKADTCLLEEETESLGMIQSYTPTWPDFLGTPYPAGLSSALKVK